MEHTGVAVKAWRPVKEDMVMRDISLHILDIVNNSLAAGADLIEILVVEETTADRLRLTIKDNGRGMDSELLDRVTSPFVTSRTTRRVGLGLSLLKAACDRSGGRLDIESEPGKGTTINACFKYSNIDRPPLGSVADTIIGHTDRLSYPVRKCQSPPSDCTQTL
jgi:phosphoglycerate-specific signal transduction histidine kinase